MIPGDRNQFAVEVERFDAPWGALGSAESVWATLTIWVDGTNITRHHRVGTDRIRDAVNAPLLPLGQWIVRNRLALTYEERSLLDHSLSPHEQLLRWGATPPRAGVTEDAWLDRRDDWWASHFTGAATLDVVMPSVGIVRNDEWALVSWQAPRQTHPDREFLAPGGAAVVSWEHVDDALGQLLSLLSEWTGDLSQWLPASDPMTALAMYTGLPATAVADYGFRPAATSDPASDPLAQVVRDLSHETALGPARAEIAQFVRRPRHAQTAGWMDLRRRLTPMTAGSFEETGYDGVTGARELLGLDGQAIEDVDACLRGLGIRIEQSMPSAGDRMAVTGSLEGDARVLLFRNPRTVTPWGRRFELMRALGHLLLDPTRSENLGAASGLHGLVSRRRRAGAFAAEMLLPVSALSDASGGVLDGIVDDARFSRVLGHFGVGATTAAYHLWNHGFLSTPEVRDDLIASSSGHL